MPGAKPKPTKDSAITQAEKMFAEMMRKGKVKDIEKAKNQVAKKTGVWPNGRTN